ncbi:hypothetical protein QBC34DRAFT_312922 [Podospora aff. communis PSN243]|uniref:Uncharacterized protein n=1 Tax=Podospora aff. communis PSN243 TaxID=3040156 RepID=A0AAV9G5A6_9PEZI|nr:hypothetical protein QBC34DRAFT_312922 [Podospora aff. communis PSN243]
MATEITPEGHVIIPRNIRNPAPFFNLRGFQWRGTDTGSDSTSTSDESHQHHDDAADQVLLDVDGPARTFQKVEAVSKTAPLPPQIPAPPSDHGFLEKQLGFKDPAGPILPFPLEQFQGTWAGNGFNMIFRPAPFKKLTVNPGEGPNDNILELNLTTEQWSFGPTLGKIPNRGFGEQPDIDLGGLPYLQTVQNVTNEKDGLGNLPPTTENIGIHFEPGVFLTAPPAIFHEGDAKNRPSVVRMASIPHGTTINAQGIAPVQNKTKDTPFGGKKGKPTYPRLDTTPFDIGDPSSKGRQEGVFISMDATKFNKFRIPANLDKFAKNGTITTEIIKDPNEVLKAVTDAQEIGETITFDLHTGPPGAQHLNGGGTANISFLAGKQAPVEIKDQAGNGTGNPNAHADFMTNTWWIMTVAYDVVVDPQPKGSTRRYWAQLPAGSRAPTPEFAVTAGRAITKRETIRVTGWQMQYSQTVNLNFGLKGKMLTWPHVSVATLVPTEPQPVVLK